MAGLRAAAVGVADSSVLRSFTRGRRDRNRASTLCREQRDPAQRGPPPKFSAGASGPTLLEKTPPPGRSAAVQSRDAPLGIGKPAESHHQRPTTFYHFRPVRRSGRRWLLESDVARFLALGREHR